MNQHKTCSIQWGTPTSSSLSETAHSELITCTLTSPLRQETALRSSQQRSSPVTSTVTTVSQLEWRNWVVWEETSEAASSIYTGLKTQVKRLLLPLPITLNCLALRTSAELKSSLRMKNAMTWSLMLRPRERAYSNCIKKATLITSA